MSSGRALSPRVLHQCTNASSTTDIAYEASQAKFDRSAIQYSSTDKYAIGSYLARILTTNWDGDGTTITLMFKEEPGVTPENLSTTAANALQAKNCNVYAAYNDGTANIQYGQSCSGQYTDAVIGCDWLSQQIVANCYTDLKTQPKIPQTDAGMHQLGTAIADACEQAVKTNRPLLAICTARKRSSIKSSSSSHSPSSFSRCWPGNPRSKGVTRAISPLM